MDARLMLSCFFIACSTPVPASQDPFSIHAASTGDGLVEVSASAPDATRVRFIFPDGFTVDDTRAPFSVKWNAEKFAGEVEIQAEAFIPHQSGSQAKRAVSVAKVDGWAGFARPGLEGWRRTAYTRRQTVARPPPSPISTRAVR